ncbi:PH-like domain-containing protein [Nakamurella sp. GG22]
MERALLVIALVAVCVLAGYGLWVGWRHRSARQSDIAAPPPTPDDLGPDLVPPLTGVYISTTAAGSWQDRIVAHGLGRRAAGAARLSVEGVCIERDGEGDIFVPISDLAAVTTAPGIAGKVMGQPDGILIVRWNLGGTLVDSGFRADDRDAQDDFIDAVIGIIPAVSAIPHPIPGTEKDTDSPTNGAPR